MLKRLAHSASDGGTDGPAGAVQHHAIAVAPAQSVSEAMHSNRAPRGTTTSAAAAFIIAIALLWVMHFRAIWPGFGFARVRAAQSGHSGFAVLLSLVACQLLLCTGAAVAVILVSTALRHRITASPRGSMRWSWPAVILLVLRVFCALLGGFFALSGWSCRSSGVPLSAIDVAGGRSDEAHTGFKQLSSSLAAAVDSGLLIDVVLAIVVAALMLLVRDPAREGTSSSGGGGGGGSSKRAWFLSCTRLLGSLESQLYRHPLLRSLGFCLALVMLGWMGSSIDSSTLCFESPLLTLGRIVTRAVSAGGGDDSAAAAASLAAGQPFVDRRVWDLQFGSMDAFTSSQQRRLIQEQRAKLLGPIASPDHGGDADSAADDSSLPNIVLFLTESVGSSNLFPADAWAPALTPWLCSLVAQASASAASSSDGDAAGGAGTGGALAWSTVYSPFPATVRSHISLFTGGKTITSGSVWTELALPYTAPTLVSALRARGYRTGAFSAGYMNSENDDGYWRSLGFDEVNFPEDWPADQKTRYETSSWGVDERRMADIAMEWAETGLFSNVSAPRPAEGEANYARRPWFLVFNTAASHHPYSVPADWIDPELPSRDSGGSAEAEGEVTDAQKSQAAIRFIDSVLGQMITRLQSPSFSSSAGAGLPPIRRRTIVSLTGDHGEAFGAVHPGNFLHRNFLYEENVRSYFVMAQLPPAATPAAASKAIIKPAQPLSAEAREKMLASLPALVTHPGSNGQILPTLLESIDGLSRSDSLFAPASAPSSSASAVSSASSLPSSRIHYFYKLASPMQLGLRDGQFKFICPLQISTRKVTTTSSSSSGSGSSVRSGSDVASPSLSELLAVSELYDLSADPLEHVNLAALHPQRLQRYRELAVVWYEDTQREFVSLLSDPASTLDPAAALLAASFEAHSASELPPDADRVGPYRLDVGWLAFEDQFQLSPTDEVQMDTELAVRALVANPEDQSREYTYRFLSPQGTLHELPFVYEAGWRNVYVYPKATMELEEGLWTVTLFHPDDGAVLSKAFWIVS